VRQRGPDWLRPERGPTDKAPADGDGGLTGVGPGLTPPGALSTRGAGGLFLRRRRACGPGRAPQAGPAFLYRHRGLRPGRFRKWSFASFGAGAPSCRRRLNDLETSDCFNLWRRW